jgi:hypothetical protein
MWNSCQTAGSEQSQPRGEAMWAAAGKAVEKRLPKSSEAHIMLPHALDIKHEVTGFKMFPDGFWSYLDRSFHGILFLLE